MVVVGGGTLKGIFMFIFTGIIFFTISIVCLLWPNEIQKYVLKYYAEPMSKFNPLLPWMKTCNYVWTLRVVGIIALVGSILVFLAIFYGSSVK